MISLNATFIIQVINFLLLMWILNRLLFRPILRALDEREETVAGSLRRAGETAATAQSERELYEAKMKQAQLRAGETKDRVRREGVEEASGVVKKVSLDAEKQIAETSAAVARSLDRARGELEDLSKEISREIYRKVLEGK